MPSKHSKNCGDRGHFTYNEKKKAGLGSITQRIGTDSQLPFGHCSLSLAPISDAVISPSGHIYSREAILEYLLTKGRELKEQAKQYEIQQLQRSQQESREKDFDEASSVASFAKSQEGITTIVKRDLTSDEKSASYLQSRKRIIDDTESAVKLEQLKQVSPWIVQFTPSADAKALTEPPKRPPSPFSGKPLRAKDLLPVNLVKESGDTSRYVCPVSRKTITNQRCVFLKNCGTLMLESAAEDLAYPSMTCPITSKVFKQSDIVKVASASSSFAASGQVEAKRYRPSIN